MTILSNQHFDVGALYRNEFRRIFAYHDARYNEHKGLLNSQFTVLMDYNGVDAVNEIRNFIHRVEELEYQRVQAEWRQQEEERQRQQAQAQYFVNFKNFTTETRKAKKQNRWRFLTRKPAVVLPRWEDFNRPLVKI